MRQIARDYSSLKMASPEVKGEGGVRAPDAGAGGQVCGIDYDKLYLVRVQQGLDGDHLDGGALCLNRSGAGAAQDRNTAHFTINSIVRDNYLGSFAGSVAIIAPFVKAVQEGGNTPSGLSPGDSWIDADEKGDIRLPEATILAPDDFPIPPHLEALVQRYPHGSTPEETRERRDKAIAQAFERRGAPLIALKGSEGANSLQWNDVDFPAQVEGFRKLADRFMSGKEVGVLDLHSNSPAGDWERRFDLLDYRISQYREGERQFLSNTGEDVDLFVEITHQIEKGKEFIEERKKKGADPRAVSSYQRQLNRFAQEVDTNLLPCHQEVVKGKVAEGRFVSSSELAAAKLDEKVLASLRKAPEPASAYDGLRPPPLPPAAAYDAPKPPPLPRSMPARGRSLGF